LRILACILSYRLGHTINFLTWKLPGLLSAQGFFLGHTLLLFHISMPLQDPDWFLFLALLSSTRMGVLQHIIFLLFCPPPAPPPPFNHLEAFLI